MCDFFGTRWERRKLTREVKFSGYSEASEKSQVNWNFPDFFHIFDHHSNSKFAMLLSNFKCLYGDFHNGLCYNCFHVLLIFSSHFVEIFLNVRVILLVSVSFFISSTKRGAKVNKLTEIFLQRSNFSLSYFNTCVFFCEWRMKIVHLCVSRCFVLVLFYWLLCFLLLCFFWVTIK